LTRRVVIVGGGFGGVTLAKRLRGVQGLEVTLLSEQNYTTFSPMLPEVVSATVLPGQVIAPLRQMLGRDQRFVMGRVTGIDVDDGRLSYEVAGERHALDFDHCVLALGARAKPGLIPGMAEHGIPLKLIGDAARIRNHVIAALERADQESDPAARRRLTRFVVVGGGFSGVEVAGEIHDFVHAAARFYPNVDAAELGVAVVHTGERLLPELPAKLAHKAADSMAARGIDLHLGTRATAADAGGLTIARADGPKAYLEAATLVATIGTAANPVIDALDVPKDGGRVVTRGDLAVAGKRGLWALGDCARVPNAATGGPAPPTAQFAVRQADTLARNLVATERGGATRAFDFAGLGTIATIGSQRGIADVMGVPVTGFPAWLLWRGFYLLQMPTLSRKLRLWVAWTWDMLFASDISQLDFTASDEVDAQRRGPAVRPAERLRRAHASAAADG
jgi:NADH dehydrogenase